ncbi:hypothetical protein [Sporosarcina sp.]|uniref:hypothetical protein n=1 Tax=Sporosarcina sp. TaxID=49982 RepID=UPI002610F033|nr:hypothetical protein [Sporosarcina sp.]
MTINKYLDLSDQQIENLAQLMSLAKNSHFKTINENYNNIIRGRTLIDKQNQTLHSLMNQEINFEFFRIWITKLLLDQYNDIYIFEPSKKEINTIRIKAEMKLEKLKKKQKFIFDFNSDNLKGIELIHVEESDQEIFFSFIAPIFKLDSTVTPPVNEKSIYFFYVWYNKKLKHFVISLPSISNIVSFNGTNIKRNDFDCIVGIIQRFFFSSYVKIDFEKTEWILEALQKITKEFYHHNNDIIDKKLDILETENLNSVADTIQKLDSSFNDDLTKARIKKALMDLLESEFIIHYGHNINKDRNFEVFLHEAIKGEVNYTAHNKANSFSFLDSRDIIKKILYNSNNSSIGLIFNFEEKQYPFKVFRMNNYFALKSLSNKTTSKEVVDNVLCKLVEYRTRPKAATPGKKIAKDE